MFSRAVSVGTRLNDWKTNPIRSRRRRVSALSFSRVRSVSPMNTWPEVSSSSPATGVHEGRLARARGAHDGGEGTGAELDVDAVEGSDGAVALAVDLHRADGAGGGHGGRGRPRGRGDRRWRGEEHGHGGTPIRGVDRSSAHPARASSAPRRFPRRPRGVRLTADADVVLQADAPADGRRYGRTDDPPHRRRAPPGAVAQGDGAEGVRRPPGDRAHGPLRRVAVLRGRRRDADRSSATPTPAPSSSAC